MIPLSIPNFEGNEKKYVNDALEQGWVSTGGAYVSKLEKMLSDYLKVDDVAACQSGTSALHLSLLEAGVCSGDIVIVPTLTFIAAVNPVKYQHATPVFIDCDDSFCMDPVKLSKFCKEQCEYDGEILWFHGQKVKAIVVVHVFGNMADMVSIMTIAREYNLKVIEDATEALGTYYTKGIYQGKYAGTIGDFGAFSFNGNKIITTGGGGAVTSNNPKNVAHMRYLSTQAKDDPKYYIHNEVGFNYRMTNLQAALGVAQLEVLPTFICRKQDNFAFYQSLFKDFDLCKLHTYREGTNSNYWFYALEIGKEIKANIKEIVLELEKRGIQVRTIWGLVSSQKPYQKEYVFCEEKASSYLESIINIPCSTQITSEEMEYVASQIKAILLDTSEE